ncbi:sialin [Anastrepha obliqua]|uniref:sialin n=1 Tax=Anastrepha obliqua TaxID=95512 RepID=UPI002408FF87|nr:sialin [Anastrepha obliqua]XP_054745641.1 sialin [Anastrepha obliqua]XP_054745642.1 sialin [Anastrepha obliqua]
MYNSHSEHRASKGYAVTQDSAVTTSAEDGRLERETNFCHHLNARIPARLVLYFLSWSGFLVSFMMRNDINFALVAMTRASDEWNSSIATVSSNNTLFTLNNSAWVNVSLQHVIENATKQAVFDDATNKTVINQKMTAGGNDGFYDWSPAVKSIILSSFYWCYVLSQVVGGIATQYFGTKQVFGWSQFATALCSLCIPVSADLHYSAVILLRSVQGFASGLTWPAMYAIVGYWIPLAERSRFMSSFQGFSIGIGLTYPLCGFIIYNFGWRYVFYTTGSLGIIWCILWYYLAFNTPKEHPRISAEEIEYIEVSVSSEAKEALRMKVPWKSIFISLPAWAIGITTFGRIWIHYIFIVCGPSFMKNMLKFNYKANGFLSGMPFICSYISSVLFCYVADKIMLNNWMSLTNVRKLFTALSQVVPGILIYWIGYIDKNILLLLVIWFVAVTFITASYAGAMANIVDIAPNLAGPVLAFCQTIHMSASFLSPLVSGIIVTNESSIEQWRTVFGVSSAITILTYGIFQIYGTAEIQSWNYPQPRIDGSAEESQILKKRNEEPIPKDDM